MASSIAASTLTVTITEAITLNGYDRGSSNSLTVASVLNCDLRTHTISTTEEDLLKVGTTASGGQYAKGSVRYCRITNKDDTNHCILVMKNTGNSSANEIAISLDKGQSYIVPVDAAGGTDATLQSSTSALSVAGGMTLDDLISITAVASTGTCMLEVFIASR